MTSAFFKIMSQLNTLMCVSKSDRTGGTCRGDSGGKIKNIYMEKTDKYSLTRKLFKYFILQH